MPDGNPETLGIDKQKLEELEKKISAIESIMDKHEAPDDFKKTIRATLAKLRAEVEKINQRITKVDEAARDRLVGAQRAEVDAEIAALAKRSSPAYLAFKSSFAGWCNSAQRALNAALGYDRNDETASGLELSDIVGIVAIIFPPAKFAAVGWAQTGAFILQTVEKTAGTIKNSGPHATPTVNRVHKVFFDAFEALGKDAPKVYAKLLADEQKRGIHTRADIEAFVLRCESFANHLPSQTEIQKAFLERLVDSSEDKDSWWNEGSGKSGYVRITVSAFHCGYGLFERVESKVTIDDVDSGTLNSLKTVWGSKPITALPFPIELKLHTRDQFRYQYTHSLKRNSKSGKFTPNVHDKMSHVKNKVLKLMAEQLKKTNVSHLKPE